MALSDAADTERWLPDVSRRTAATNGGVRNIPPLTCSCGRELPPAAATGRPRVHCSRRCRDAATCHRRKVRRITEAIAAWRHEERLRQAKLSRYSRAEIRAELRTLQAELLALERTLSGEKS